MQIVINVNDELMEYFANHNSMNDDGWFSHSSQLLNAFRNGVKLPKGHGKLKDTDKIANDVNALKDNWNRYGNEYESGRYESYDYAVDMINDAPTIIEADKEESEVRNE